MVKNIALQEIKSGKYIQNILITQARPESDKSPYFEMAKRFKVNLDFEKFLKRLIIQLLGWEKLNFIMRTAIKQKSLSASDKSKKLKQFRIAMLDNSSFEFQEHTIELNHKIKVMYVEALKQIFKMEQLSQQERVK